MSSIERVPPSMVISAARLSQKESKIFSYLQPGDPVTIDEMVERIGSASTDDVSAKAITMAIKSLAFKIAQCGYKVSMVGGGRGRGKKGVYKLERIK